MMIDNIIIFDNEGIYNFFAKVLKHFLGENYRKTKKSYHFLAHMGI